MLLTKDIELKYDVTRQTLNNWIKQNLISKPKKDNNGRLVWSRSNETELKSILKLKGHVKIEENIPAELLISNRRYLGSKQKAIDFIDKVVCANTSKIESVADVFAGTGIVADLFRSKGKKVIVNDLLYSNYVSYHTWFGNDEIDYNKIKELINELNLLDGTEGYVTTNFGDKYFSHDNAMKIDSIREKIEEYDNLNTREYYMLLTSLMYAADKVANTVGHYDAYRKELDNNIPLHLKVPKLNKNDNNEIFNIDANQLVKQIYADLVYIDTPYNSRGYESAYHVLENIVEWEKPEVEGVARKAINRQEKGSDYTKSKAHKAFDDLISNINAKYILVSYNNMSNKGNSRSNAKISHDEILLSLEKRGRVKIFEMDFLPFTTGKSNINNHKELLYLCEIGENLKYIECPLNYTGNKHKLLNQIFPSFPKNIKRFYDIFAGGATVAVNHALHNLYGETSYIINDIEYDLIDLYLELSRTNIDTFISEVERLIEQFNLSNSSKYGSIQYMNNESDGYANYNRENYNRLKSFFNSKQYEGELEKNAIFYLLITYGFNNQIRYNTSGNFNLPVGKRDFNAKMKKKLKKFHLTLSKMNFNFFVQDFTEFKDVKRGDFVYADPPYSLATASYNENGAWTNEDDTRLFKYLDYVNKKGAKFALSNIVLHKGRENEALMHWASKYTLHVLDYNYDNSNYQSKAKSSSTVEVLITNY